MARTKVAQPVLNYNIPYEPHDAQREFHLNSARFRVLACPRRWGKTLAMMMEAWKVLRLASFSYPVHKVPRGWIIAPTFPLVEEDWRVAIELFGGMLVERNVARMSMLIPLGNGRVGELEFKSAERKDEGLRGAGIVFAGLDEASRIEKEAWELGVRPALSDLKGRAVFISTPFGKNWFYECWLMGQGGDPDWKSWRFPAESNPYFPRDELETLRRTLPKLVFQQEYEADFLENASSVFHGLGEVEGGSPRLADVGDRFSIGVDLAKSVDFTVVVVLDQHGVVVNLYRSHDNEWSLQKKTIEAIYQRYKPSTVWIDSSGVGDPMEEQIWRAGVSVRGLKTNSAQVKSELVEGLIVAIEQKQIRIPSEKTHPEYHWLWEELRSFGLTMTDLGHIRYQAPDGRHDDGVIALALAVHGATWLGKKEILNPPPNRYTTWGEYKVAADPKRAKVLYRGGHLMRRALNFRVV